MKKKTGLFLLFIVFAINGLLAQSSQLTIFHQNGERFWVIIDGIKQTPEPQASVFLPDIKQDFLRVKIIFENEKIKDIDKNVQTKDYDGNFTHSKYIIRPEKNKTVMRLHSFEVITPQTQVVTQPVETQPVTIPSHTVKENPSTETMRIGTQVIDPETGKPIEMDVKITVPTTEIDEPGFSTQTQVTHRESHRSKQPERTITQTETPKTYQMPGYNGKIGCPWPMSEQDFTDAKRSISSKTFEDTKLTVAKQITSSNCLLCTQVKEIMGLFTFEDSKLQFAKYAYDYVYDLNNYYKLNDAFTFSSSVDELDTYVRGKNR